MLEARGEMKVLAEEFGELARQAGVPTPSIDALGRYLGEGTQRTAVAMG